MHSESVSRDKCVFLKSGKSGWKSIHLGTSGGEWSSEYKCVSSEEDNVCMLVPERVSFKLLILTVYFCKEYMSC